MFFAKSFNKLATFGLILAWRGPVVLLSDNWTTADVCERVLPAVFRILADGVVRRDLGTGFFIRPDGTAVTAAHVVSCGGEFLARLDSGQEYPVKVMKKHEMSDIALVKVQGPGNFPYLQWADSSKARRGEMVIHFGNPGNRKTTEIDVGFIDALDYCIPKDVRALNYDEGENQGVQYLMSKGMIKPGFSGGPCVNMKGEVVGVMSKLFLQGQIANVDHACISVPSKVVKGVVQQMLASGNVQKPYVGLSFVQNNPGIAVVKVQKGSPAEKAGVCVGDVILTANGKSVDSYEDISGVIGFDLGTVLELKVNRNNTILDLKINT